MGKTGFAGENPSAMFDLCATREDWLAGQESLQREEAMSAVSTQVAVTPKPEVLQPSSTTTDEDWREFAACRGLAEAGALGLFFRPSGSEYKHEKLDREKKAKDICARCPVIRECLEDALKRREPHGILGGLNEDERSDLLPIRLKRR